jgi:hypothetical protein
MKSSVVRRSTFEHGMTEMGLGRVKKPAVGGTLR